MSQFNQISHAASQPLGASATDDFDMGPMGLDQFDDTGVDPSIDWDMWDVVPQKAVDPMKGGLPAEYWAALKKSEDEDALMGPRPEPEPEPWVKPEITQVPGPHYLGEIFVGNFDEEFVVRKQNADGNYDVSSNILEGDRVYFEYIKGEHEFAAQINEQHTFRDQSGTEIKKGDYVNLWEGNIMKVVDLRVRTWV